MRRMTGLMMRNFVMSQLRSHRVQMLDNLNVGLNVEEISSEKKFEEYFQ